MTHKSNVTPTQNFEQKKEYTLSFADAEKLRVPVRKDVPPEILAKAIETMKSLKF